MNLGKLNFQSLNTMNQVVYFCSEKPERYSDKSIAIWTFSNWYKQSYTGENGQTYSCSEQEMMHHKALLFNDTKTAELILQSDDPKQIKALGRQINGYRDKDWVAVRAEIVYKAVRAKFLQHSDLTEALLNTGDRYIAEAADYDRVWGIGFSAANADANKEAWGENLLGEILMGVREELRRNIE